jgi:CRP-like cAMP-binding protein
MPSSGIAAVSSELRVEFLDGLAPLVRKKILGAATERQLPANSVATNHGHPADYLFLLTKGLVRHFVITEAGRKLLFQWRGPGELFGGLTVLSIHSSYLFSTETVTDTSVLVWDRPTIRGERVVRCVRLPSLATGVPYKFSLPYRSTAGCSSSGYS